MKRIAQALVVATATSACGIHSQYAGLEPPARPVARSPGHAWRSARRAVDKLVRAYGAARRLLTPTANEFELAGDVLQRLKKAGLEGRRSSLVDDVLIALTARGIGAAVLTADADFGDIGAAVDVFVERVR